MLPPKLIPFPGYDLPLRAEPIDRTFHGLLAVGLLDDIRDRWRSTLIAPTNAAFDALPWSFEDLLGQPSLAEVRFDLFEYLVVPGDLVVGERRTIEGSSIRIEDGQVLGRFGRAARILRSFVSGNLRVHVVDACVLPASPAIYVDAANDACEERSC